MIRVEIGDIGRFLTAGRQPFRHSPPSQANLALIVGRSHVD
jgi:hypothetical protein